MGNSFFEIVYEKEVFHENEKKFIKRIELVEDFSYLERKENRISILKEI